MISLLARKRPRPGLLGIEKLGLIYALLTLVVALIFRTSMPELPEMLLTRGIFVVLMIVAIAIYRRRACHLTFLLRNAVQLFMLGAWYPETYLFCRQLGNLDHVFAALDQTLFSCQPALLFSEALTSRVWSELFYLGYFSYYPMIFAAVLWMFFRNYLRMEKTSFIILCSFFVYYVVFMFLPVAGPQYYYPAIGLDNVAKGIFPAVGNYFMDHFDIMEQPGRGGFFRACVDFMQSAGERPTAAFPSSHVGISTIVMILAWKGGSRKHRLFFTLLPFYLLLCPATVYIHAHYAVDAIAGLITAPLVYVVAHKLYYTKFFHRPHGYHS